MLGCCSVFGIGSQVELRLKKFGTLILILGHMCRIQRYVSSYILLSCTLLITLFVQTLQQSNDCDCGMFVISKIISITQNIASFHQEHIDLLRSNLALRLLRNGLYLSQSGPQRADILASPGPARSTRSSTHAKAKNVTFNRSVDVQEFRIETR